MDAPGRSPHPSGARWAARLGNQPTAAARGGPLLDGEPTPGRGTVTLASLGETTMAVLLELEEGYLQPGHAHPEHESIGYVLSGRLRMTVAGETAILEPGDGWWHPRNAFHITEALAPTVALEVHTPLRPDVLERLAAGAAGSLEATNP